MQIVCVRVVPLRGIHTHTQDLLAKLDQEQLHLVGFR